MRMGFGKCFEGVRESRKVERIDRENEFNNYLYENIREVNRREEEENDPFKYIDIDKFNDLFR